MKMAVPTCKSNGRSNSRVNGGRNGTVLIEECEEAGWEWLKSYRTEDAERKEYLYPENWLEPES